MKTRVIAIRPEPGSAATVAAGRAMGLAIEACPLSEIRPRPWQPPAPSSIDGLLIGSANALRHGGDALGVLRDKPVYAVGDATAEAAREHGFEVAAVGPGMLQSLLDSLAGRSLRLLRLTGVEHVPVDPPAGIRLEIRIAYENVSLSLPLEVARGLAGGALVLLHSAAAARHLGAECDRLGAPRSSISLAALGPRIAAAAGPGWARVTSAPEPREAALLALARDLCHEPPAT